MVKKEDAFDDVEPEVPLPPEHLKKPFLKKKILNKHQEKHQEVIDKVSSAKFSLPTGLSNKSPIVVPYLLFLIVIVIGYALNFSKLSIDSPIASIGFNLGFLLAIIMPAFIIIKQMQA